MPPKTGPAAAGDSAKAAPARKTSARPAAGSARGTAARAAAKPMPLRTFAQALDAQSFEPHGEADNDPLTRSFHLRVGVVERAKATSDGIQHRAYGTEIEDNIPQSLAAFVTEALEAACTYYERLLNDGKEFRRVRSLSPGPSPEGARRGAAKRAAARGARAAGS